METIEAFADETVFRNDENGYTVLVIKAGKSRVSAVGVMPPVTSGEKLRINDSKAAKLPRIRLIYEVFDELKRP